jgi:hypothetical protein
MKTNLWQLRRRIAAQLEASPPEKQPQLRAALRGCDLVMRANVVHGVRSEWSAVPGPDFTSITEQPEPVHQRTNRCP